MSKLKVFVYLLAVLALFAFGATSSQPAFAQSSSFVQPTSSSTPKTFVSYATFLKNVESANYRGYTAQHTRVAIQSDQAFSAMRSYVLTMYAGVQQVSSYLFNGQYFDCITISSQPTVSHLNIKQIAKPPVITQRSTTAKAGTSGLASASPLTLGQKDAFGNTIGCKAGTIPMERITLERMNQFPTLQAFLAKEPGGQKASSQTILPGGPHRYAVGYQYVTNYGGNSWLNLWNPSGDFSLSQQWYVGGSGSSTQTVEGGWVHYPGKFGSQSVLFIFYTPDNYVHGCYNLDCTGFVQTNSSWALGGAWSNYSTYGGTQYGFTMQWQYYQGNWWLYLQGAGSIQAVGYYPGSIYNQGQLASSSQLLEYGGETYTAGSNWPQMGSGKFASAGWQQAAYQSNIFYIPNSQGGATGVWTSLSSLQTNPACYTINITNSGGTYFYFGGPGGYC